MSVGSVIVACNFFTRFGSIHVGQQLAVNATKIRDIHGHILGEDLDVETLLRRDQSIAVYKRVGTSNDHRFWLESMHY